MKVIVCGPSNSGTTRIVRLLIHIAKMKNLKVNIIKSDVLSFSNDMDIYECTNFWKVYPSIKDFDFVIMCVRDCRYICETILEMADYVQYIQSWSLFSSLTVRYEMYGPEQIMEISNLLQIPLTYNNVIELLEKVRIVPIKSYYSDKTKEIHNHFVIYEYLLSYGYEQQPNTTKIPHSASF